ncbi:MAG: triose-phosphate isomerase [Candidatus Liptonbacteria bacterium]
MSKYVIANWKMNPVSYSEAQKLAKAIGLSARKYRNVKVVVCPPFTWLTDMSHEKEFGLEYGAQDVFWKDEGAFTGEVSSPMLKNSKVKYAIVGHSERRKLGETDAQANLKIKSALANGITPILCVGEDKKIHSRGLAAVTEFIAKQLRASLKNVSGSTFQDSGILIAYEPIWAISTNPGAKPDNPEQASTTIFSIRKVLASMFHVSSARRRTTFQVLYGGSVNSQNAEGFLFCPEISGVLVGGASLKPAEFGEIIRAAHDVSADKKVKNKKIKK